MECLYLNIRDREEICLVWHHYHHPVYLQTHIQVPFPVHNCFIIFPRSQKPPVSQTPQTPLDLQMLYSWVDGSVVCDGGWVWLRVIWIWYLVSCKKRREGIASKLEAETAKEQHKGGLEGLRQTVASTYKTTSVGVEVGAISTGRLEFYHTWLSRLGSANYSRPVRSLRTCCPITRTMYGKNQPSFNNHINTCDDSDEGHEPGGEVGLNG